MALSGSFYTNVRSGWRLQAEWSATQNISANQSTVTVKLYWMSLGSYYTVNSSATKSGNIKIEGTTYSFSGAGIASLKGNQKRLLTTEKKTITHNSDGTFSDLDIECNFDPDVSLSGSNPGNIRISKSYALNTIPRASTISSSANWTAGKNLPVTISRKSSSFKHTVKVYVEGTLIATKEDVTTSTTFSFSDSQNETIYDKINGNAGADTKIEVTTYKGSSKIGSAATKTGRVAAIDASTLSSSASFTIGDPVNISISRADSYITHTVKIYVNNTLIKTLTGVGSSTTWTPSATEITNMYKQVPNSNSVGTRIDVYGYWGSEVIRNERSKTGTARVANSNPIFGTGFTYQDTNTASRTLTGNTGNDGLIIQNQSNVQVTLPSSAFATAQNSATIKQYVATLNGKEVVKTPPSSGNIIFDLGKVNAESDVTLSVKAVDSRGNSTTSRKTVKVAPYLLPKINSTITRKNNYESTTTIKSNGSISLVNGKNAIQSLQYRYRENKSGTSFGSWVNITRTTSGSNFTGSNTNIELDNTKPYVFEIKATDKLGSTTITKNVSSGRPIMAIDTEKASVGIGMFPTDSQQLQVDGKITTKNNLGTIELSGRDFKVDNLRAMVGLPNEKKVSINYQKDFTDGLVTYGDLEVKDGTIHTTPNKYLNSGGALNMHNGDIADANGIYFGDTSNGGGEGLNFIKSGVTAGSTSHADYDNLYVLNGVGYINGSPAFLDDERTVLWSGELYMTGGHEVTPKKNILDCPNGWALVWSRYASGAQNDNFIMTFIPRGFVLERGDTGGIRQVLVDKDYKLSVKYVYVRNNGKTLLGHAMNGEDDSRKYMVLRYIMAM